MFFIYLHKGKFCSINFKVNRLFKWTHITERLIVIRKSFALFLIFFLGFFFGVKADKYGFNNLGLKKNIDMEMQKVKESVITFGESLSDDGFFLEIIGGIIVFIGMWAEWLFLLYIIIVAFRLIIVYLR